MPKKVFISYRSTERLQIKALINEIEKLGDYDVWYDQELRGGQKWWDEIMRNLEDADIVILAISNAYLESYPCKLERDYAIELNKAIIPVQIDANLNYQDLEYNLSTSQIVRYDSQIQDGLGLKDALDVAKSGKPPHPLPKIPPIPVPPLLEIKQALSSANLDYADQKTILDQLNWHMLEHPDDKAEVYELLATLQSRNDVASKISDLINQIIPKDKVPKYNPQLIIGGIVIAVVVIGFIAFMLMQPNNDNPPATTESSETPIEEASPTDDPTQDEAPSATDSVTVGESGSFDVTLIYGGQDSFTVKLNTNSNLSGITLETVDAVETITDTFLVLSALDNVGEAGNCFRYLRDGSSPPLPRACNVNSTFVVTLSGADVFWYNDGTNQFENIAFKQDGEVLKLCSHGNGSGTCDVLGE